LIGSLTRKYHSRYSRNYLKLTSSNFFVFSQTSTYESQESTPSDEKYDLLAKIRRRNPYKIIMKKTREHAVVPNLLNREFCGNIAFRKIGTDITYVRFRGRWIYLSIVKDMITSEILSIGVSDSFAINLIMTTFSRFERRKELQ
jgi:hypothetical protein